MEENIDYLQALPGAMSRSASPADEALQLESLAGAEGQDESHAEDYKGGSSTSVTKKMICQVPGCTSDLLAEGKPYCLKKRLCTEHMRADAVRRRGYNDDLWRFCFQCGKLELLSQFDGAKRSCRVRLQKRRQPPKRSSSWGAGSALKLAKGHVDGSCMMYDAAEDWMDCEDQLNVQLQQQMQHLHIQQHRKQQLLQLMQQQHMLLQATPWPGSVAMPPPPAAAAALNGSAQLFSRVRRVSSDSSSLATRLAAAGGSSSSSMSGQVPLLPDQPLLRTGSGSCSTGQLPAFPGAELPGQPFGQPSFMPGQLPGFSGQVPGQLTSLPGQMPTLSGFKQPAAATAAETLQVPGLMMHPCQPFVAPADATTAAAAASQVLAAAAAAGPAAASSLDHASMAAPGDAANFVLGDDDLEACLNELLADASDLDMEDLDLAELALASTLTAEVGLTAAGASTQQRQQGLLPAAAAEPARLPPLLEDKSFRMSKAEQQQHQQQILMMLQQTEPYPAAAGTTPGATWSMQSPQTGRSPHSSASSSPALNAAVDCTAAATAAAGIAPQQLVQQQQLLQAHAPGGPAATAAAAAAGMHPMLKFLTRCGDVAETVLSASVRNLAETVTRLDPQTAQLLFKQLKAVRVARKNAAAAAASSGSYSSSSCVTGQVGAMPFALQQQQQQQQQLWQQAVGPASVHAVPYQPCNMP